MSSQSPKRIEKLSFEQALGELETLVEQIESGEIGLEQALKQYERGMALIQRCRSVLAQAEQRIAELTENEQGELGVEQEEESSEQ